MNFLKEKALNIISNYFGQEKGIFLKIAQMAGTSSESMEEYKNLSLGTELKAIPLSEIKNYIEQSLKHCIDDLFLSFDEAKWVASLGQVHLCKFKNDTGIYAAKVLYPKINEKINEQIRLLGFIGHIGANTKLKKWGFDVHEYIAEMTNSLDIETNYTIEKNNIKKFNELNSHRDIIFPNVHEFSTDKVLITTYCEGISLDIFQVKATHKQKEEFSRKLLTAYLQQFFLDGFFQGDTHKGNFYVKDSTPIFFDFGHFLTLNKERKNSFNKMIVEILKGNLNLDLNEYSKIGFDPVKLSYIQEYLPVIISSIFMPFLLDEVFDLHNWEISKEINKNLDNKKWWFRSSGNAFVFQLIRSLMGLFTILKDYGAPLNYRKVLIKALSLEKKSLIESSLYQINTLPEEFNLKIQISKNNKKIVDLTFPYRAVSNLEDFIDFELNEKLIARNIDISKIKKEILNEEPQEKILFQLEEGEKNFKVFISRH
ncbi:MAG: AarF/ABC1/UbiB kinase family protein [Halobacteriovoraceae bacterium]|nr:AarF/ABC1/UbiB kinase family protein [Halobacteriovoraceae bacterium]